MAEALVILVFTLLTASMFIVGDVPVVMGSILASGAGERRGVRLIVPLLIAGALVFSEAFPVGKAISVTLVLIGACLFIVRRPRRKKAQ